MFYYLLFLWFIGYMSINQLIYLFKFNCVTFYIFYSIIRELLKKIDPINGSSPILVLSYKNHAIDEFLLDLLKSEHDFWKK
jgi:hypothetical protein